MLHSAATAAVALIEVELSFNFGRAAMQPWWRRKNVEIATSKEG